MRKERDIPIARNRRVSGAKSARSHVLDVRVRRSTAQRQRKNRVLRTILGVTLWLGVAAGVVYGFQAVTNKFFLQNPEYNLRVVDTNLDDLMTHDEALRLSGLVLGTNIFRLDLGAAEQAFRRIDQIDTVTIQREWPATVRIHLTKRIPIAWLAKAGDDFSTEHAFLLDAAGRPMKPYRVEPEYWRLPVIFATDPALIRNGDLLATADLKAALDLLAARAARANSLLTIRSIDITQGYCLEVTDETKARITFSPKDPGTQLDRVQKLLENCRETGRQLDTVNLIPKKYTPVRFLLVSLQDPSAALDKPKAKTTN